MEKPKWRETVSLLQSQKQPPDTSGKKDVDGFMFILRKYEHGDIMVGFTGFTVYLIIQNNLIEW